MELGYVEQAGMSMYYPINMQQFYWAYVEMWCPFQ